MKRWSGAVALILLAGCGQYTEVVLPPPGSPAKEVQWTWEAMPEPLIERGAPGAFDAVDALNPSILRRPDGYWNLYSGWDGKVWRTGLATSPDGFHWTKQGMVLSPGPALWEGNYIAANGAVKEFRGQLHYWYQAGSPPAIGLARSRDGRKWEKLPAPVVEPGPRGAWHERGVGDPYVIEAGGRLYMYFLGQDRARRQRLGVAVSDDGEHWKISKTNPILELGPPGTFDELGLGEPAVWAQFGRWWMLYTARDRQEWRRIGMAVSSDGQHWERVSSNPVIATGGAWKSRVVCDPEVEVQPDGSVRVWFGGGVRPEPAENLDGQIGAGVLRATVR